MDYELMMNGNVKIGQRAPDFEAITTFGPVKLNDYKGKWFVFFSHPGDFTPVCTTEMIAFARANTYFEQLNACLLGLSIDSNPSHLAWVNDIYLRTGIMLPFPIVADRNGQIARKSKLITTFGKFADPIADKLLINTIFLLLASDGTISIIIPIIMISRDTIVDAIRLVAANKQVVIAAKYLGKLKTVTQMISVIFLLLNDFPFSIIHLPIGQISVWIILWIVKIC